MTMSARAVVLVEPGRPLEIRELPVPVAAEGELVVGSVLGGVCGTDLHLQQGHLPVPVPLVLGHEGYGVIKDLGTGVTHDIQGIPLKVGDAVMWLPPSPAVLAHPA